MKRLMYSILVFCILVFCISGQGAHAGSSLTFENGDLIFQTSKSSQADAIIRASRSPYSHVGIVEVRDGKRYVLEAIGPVTRTPLAKWIQRGLDAKYALYRDGSLEPEQRARLLAEVATFLGRPYDIHFTMEGEAIYCSELVYLGYKRLGIQVGKMEKLKELNSSDVVVKNLAKARWKTHPLCAKAGNFENCWDLMLEDPIVTPASLAGDSRFKLLWTNFPR